MINKLIIILFILISLTLQIKLWHKNRGIDNIMQLNKEIAQKTKELNNLKLRNNILLDNIQLFKKNHAYIEEQARVVLGMIKKNETYYRIIENHNENIIK